MSEHHESPEMGIGEEQEQNEAGIQEGTEARAEQETSGVETIESAVKEGEEEGRHEIIATEEKEEREKARATETQKKKITPKPKIKEKKLNLGTMSKQLEKQTNDLARIEKAPVGHHHHKGGTSPTGNTNSTGH